VRPTARPGINEVSASIQRGDDPSQMRGLETKTVFDPTIFSDPQLNAMARDAGKLGWDDYQAEDPDTWAAQTSLK
jgi:hypothetical protein